MKDDQHMMAYHAHENDIHTKESKVFENEHTFIEIKCEPDFIDNEGEFDNYTTDILKIEIDNEHDNTFNDDIGNEHDTLKDDIGNEYGTLKNDIGNEHDDFKNDVEAKEYDFDIDVDIENNTKQITVTNNDTRNKRKISALKKKIKSETQICVKKILSNKSIKSKSISVKSVKKKKIRKLSNPKVELKVVKEIELTPEEQKAEIVKRKESDNYKFSFYKCNICYKGFRRLEPYDAHMDRHTDKFGLIECDVCHLRYKTKKMLRKHICHCHGYIYKCSICPFVSAHRTAAILHERYHDGKVYKCSHCNMEFAKVSTLLSHVRIKHPSDYVCPQCGFSFIGERGLLSHMNKKHGFKDTENLSGPLCEPCNIRFASEEAYTQHMQASPKHAPDGLLRPNCPLQNKMPNTREVPIDCEQCGMKLVGVLRYAMHFKARHPDKIRAQFTKGISKRAPKKLNARSTVESVCEKCGKVFATPALLHQHMQMHAGAKSFTCEICDKGFSTDLARRIHFMRHSGTNTFPCDVCDKVLSNAASQRRHMLLHEDSRPVYKCDDCGKSLTSARGRDLHVQHVHQNVPRPKRERRDKRHGADTGDSLT